MLCDGLFPNARSMKRPEDEEEERRLFYVAMTRACDELIISSAAMRRRYGKAVPTTLSRFVLEIPEEYKNAVKTKIPKRSDPASEQLSLF